MEDFSHSAAHWLGVQLALGLWTRCTECKCIFRWRHSPNETTCSSCLRASPVNSIEGNKVAAK